MKLSVDTVGSNLAKLYKVINTIKMTQGRLE